MIQTRTKACLTVVGAALLAGCAAVPKDAGFGDVQKTVMERTGYDVRWDRGTKADRQAADAVHEMLRHELTVDSAVEVALLENQSLQATYEDLGIAQAEVVEAGLLTNPTLGAEVRFPRSPRLPFEVDVTQSFLELLVLPLRKAAAGAAFEAAKARATHEVLNTAAGVKAAFYRAQGAEQLVGMRRSVVQAAEASFEAAEGLHDAGNITDLALASERALREQARIDLARAERHALDAREELNALMGVWGQDTQWVLAPRLPDLPPREIDPTHLESLAVSRRSDLAAARREVEAAAQNLGLSKYAAFGSGFEVGAHFEKDTDGSKTVGPAVTVPLPIFNQGQPALAAAEARLRQSRRRYQAMAVQVRSQVRRMGNDVTAARDLAEYYARVVIPLRHRIVEQTQLQVNAMQQGIFELLLAKQGEIDAGRDYVEALQDYWVARAELERAAGGRVDATVPSTQPAPAAPGTPGATTLPAAPADPLKPSDAPGPHLHHHHVE